MYGKTDEVTQSCGVRLIAIDRPGYGKSTLVSNRTYLSPLPQDIIRLADHLKLNEFGLIGYSSGGPNALALAHKFPNRVKALGLISSDGPYSAMSWSQLSWEHIFHTTMLSFFPQWFINWIVLPWILQPSMERMAQGLIQAYAHTKPHKKPFLIADIQESRLQSDSFPPAQDLMLERSPWDFQVKDVKVPTVIWHGTKDHDVPLSVSEYMHSQIKGSDLKVIEGENHSLFRRRWAEILTTIQAKL